MNLLIFIHSLSSGGAERVTANLANHWAGKGRKVTVVTMASEALDFYQLHPAIKRVALDLADKSPNLFAAVINNLDRMLALRRVLREVQPNVAVGMMSSASVLLVLATMFMPKISTVISERIYPPMMKLGFMREWARRRIYPSADSVVLLTSESLAWLNTEIPSAHGVIIPNPIPYPLPVGEPCLMPSSVIGSARKLLLAVGRLDQQKGFDILIQAFVNLAPTHLHWDIVILGEGALRQTLASQVLALGLQDRVYLPGKTGNVADWYQRADIYVMSSRFEGFPNTLGEAMAHGCAAVSFDCDTGPRDLIRHEVDGLLVSNGDADALANALGRLMVDEALRRRFADCAIEIRERFSMERIANQWEALFFQELP